MGISKAEFLAMQARLAPKSTALPATDGVEREKDLHDRLIQFYADQWPRWKVIYARQDKLSTIPVGCHDHTVFASHGRVFCFELKRGNAKPDKDQVIWHKELEMLEHKVNTIRNFEQFLAVVK